MNAPLVVAERRMARSLAERAVKGVFLARFGRTLRRHDPLYEIDPLERLGLILDIEMKLGVRFREEDHEFVETLGDLIVRATRLLMRSVR